MIGRCVPCSIAFKKGKATGSGPGHAHMPGPGLPFQQAQQAFDFRNDCNCRCGQIIPADAPIARDERPPVPSIPAGENRPGWKWYARIGDQNRRAGERWIGERLQIVTPPKALAGLTAQAGRNVRAK